MPTKLKAWILLLASCQRADTVASAPPAEPSAANPYGDLLAHEAMRDAPAHGDRASADETMGATEHGGLDDARHDRWHIGVDECDAYIEQYVKCVEKMPEAAREQVLLALEQTVEAWREAAEVASDLLADGCKAAYEAARQATQPLGCTW